MHDMVILNPPLCEPTVPLLGPYQLAGYAKKISLDLKIIDFNIELVRHIINTAKVPFNYSVEDPQRKFEIDTCRKFLDKHDISSYSDILDALRRCTSVQRYWDIIDYIRACYDMFSLRFTGIRFRLDGFDTRYRWNIWSDINKFIEEYSNSELFNVIDNWVIAHDKSISKSKVIGLNITFESQLFFSILFCIAIRRRFEDAVIVVGGGFVNSFINSPDSIGPLDEYCDLVISGEGEALLWRIKTSPLSIIEIIKKHGRYSGKRAYYASAHDFCGEKLDAVAPYFDDHNLSNHPSPSKVIPLRFTYQCYWGKCKFCSDKEPHECLRTQYSFDDIMRFCLNGKKDELFDCVYFLDSAIPPNVLERFCDQLIEQKQEIYWGTNVRADKPFTNENFIKKLSLAGCVFVKFGLESGSQKVLNLMNKGTDINDAAKFIYLCRKYGIYVHAYVMFAYPGETKLDRKATFDFLLSDYSHPDNYNCSEFILYGKAPIASELGCSFYDEITETGWHSASYSFTNDEIKREIVSMREAFEHKYKPAGVLISTGHTIAFSKKMKDKEMKSIKLYEDTVLHMSKYAFQDTVGTCTVIGRWRRRDGIVYVSGKDAQIVLDNIADNSVNNILSYGITTNTIYDLIDAGFVYPTHDKYKEPLNFEGEHQIKLLYGNELTKFHWYGFYDAG